MKKKIFKLGIVAIAILILASTPVLISAISDKILASGLKKDGHLPVVGSQEKFEELLEESKEQRNVYSDIDVFPDIVDFTEDSFDVDLGSVSDKNGIIFETTSPVSDSITANDFSNTNTQVEGVDEADIVKNDNKYIYSISDEKLVITEAYPVRDMKRVSVTDLSETVSPQEMFVAGNKLVLVGNRISSDEVTLFDTTYSYGGKSSIIIYDITDRAKPVLEKNFSITGGYMSSRRIDNKIHFIISADARRANKLPRYIEDEQTEYKEITYEDLMYTPNSKYKSFITMLSFDLDTPKATPCITPYLTDGEIVYMSGAGNLYLASTYYAEGFNEEASTIIYKFNMSSGKPLYSDFGKVPGRIINQFALDEYEGNLRIATTSNRVSKYNNVYVLSERMTRLGSVTNLAKDEDIKSARFVGDKAYLVTYEQIDPLFVIDLSNPRAPKKMGELKIPGYSTYLHPYDETHVIGFGYDGNISGGLNGQLKLALFDISDIKNPKEMYKTTIEAYSSELLNNHKALLFSKEKELIAFPVKDRYRYSYGYGHEDYSYGMVYTINLKDGFVKRGEIEHEFGSVDRMIYMDNVLYSISQDEIKASDISTIKELKSVVIGTPKGRIIEEPIGLIIDR